MWLHADSIRALNSIDAVFDKPKDKKVRDAWAAVVAQTRIQRPGDTDRPAQQQWDRRLDDLRVDLYQALGEAVGYQHTVDYLKNQSYYPQHYQNVEQELTQIRRGLVNVISGEGVKVVIAEPTWATRVGDAQRNKLDR